MANSKSGNTVNNEKAAKDYPDFVTDLMYKLHGTKSLADATRALILSHDNGDTDRELLGATFVLEDLMDKLDGIALQICSSEFSYIQKAKAAS
jgi:hypothetical protein